MTGSIFLLAPDQALAEMKEAPYDTEAVLQALLADHPALLAGEQIDPESPRRWLLVAREWAVIDPETGEQRLSLDHLFLDQEGIPRDLGGGRARGAGRPSLFEERTWPTRRFEFA